MNRRERNGLLSVAAALVLIACGTANPALAGSEGFRFWVDPVIFAVLETDVDTNSAKFEEYRDLGSGIMIPTLNVYGESEDGNRWLAIRTTKIDRQDARFNLDYGVSGKYGFELDYNKIPHRFGNDSSLVWTRTGPGRYEIADSEQERIQAAIDAAAGVDFDLLNGLLAPILDTAQRLDLAVQRNRTRAKFDLGKMGRMAWSAEYYQENRDGLRPYGAAFGFSNVTEIPEPIAYTTRETALGGEWNADNAGIRFGVRHSTFENDISTVVWDNPFRAFNSTDSRAYLAPGGASRNGPALGFADLAPDNESDTFYLFGRGRQGGWWYDGGFSYSVMTQDDPLLPYTLNSAIVGIDYDTGALFDPTSVANLPVRNADTEVEVMAFNANAGTTFGDDWSLKLRYRYYDYDNQSPRIEFPGYVRFHAVWEEVPRITVPYSYTRDRIGFELGWDASATTHLSLSYDIETWDRTFRETGETEEDIIAFAVNSRPNDKVAIRAAWETGDRSYDRYETEAQVASFLDPEGSDNQPLLRKYLQAARQYDDYSVKVDLFPRDAWMVTFGVSTREDDYDESFHGLISDELMRYNFEVSYVPGENLNFYVFGDIADRDSFQRARQSGGTLSTSTDDDWTLALNEENDTFGLGLEAKNDKGWTFDFWARVSDSDGDADFATTPAGSPSEAVDFDNYEDIELFSASLRVDYSILPSCSVGAVYLYEDYTINSFNLAGLMPYLPASLLLVPNDGNYEANLFAVYTRFTF